MISVYLSHQSTADGVRSTVKYMLDPDNPDHIHKYEISQPRWHHCTNAQDLAARVIETAEKMWSVRRPSGKVWENDVSKHYAFSFPPGVTLSAEEREVVEDTLLRIICPHSPSCIVWHIPSDLDVEKEQGRCLHPHLLMASATLSGRHRLTEQRRARGAGGEQGLLHQATADAVEQVNRMRIAHGRTDLLLTPAEAVEAARKRRREERGHAFKPLSVIVAESLSLNERADEAAVLDTLRGQGWLVEKKPGSPRLTLTAPGGQKPFFRNLFRLIDDTAEALDERREKIRAGKIAEIAHQQFGKHPERSADVEVEP